MKNDVKKKLIIILSITLVVLILSIIINNLLDNKSNNPELKRLNDEDKYFTVQRAINDYLATTDDFNAPSFTARKMYYKEKDNYTYYFINGYTIKYGESNGYKNDVNYLLINYYNKYDLKELETTSLEEYANGYNDFSQVLNDNKLPVIDYSEQIKLESYLSHFVNMLNYNNIECYNLLSDRSKNKYNSYYSFKNNISDFYNISTQIIEFTKDGNTYTITDSNNNKFKIIEESFMNYKLEI